MALTVKSLPAMLETQTGKIPLEKGMAAHCSILAGEFHGQRSLVGYSAWGHRESDMTERLTHIHTGKYITL